MGIHATKDDRALGWRERCVLLGPVLLFVVAAVLCWALCGCRSANCATVTLKQCEACTVHVYNGGPDVQQGKTVTVPTEIGREAKLTPIP